MTKEEALKSVENLALEDQKNEMVKLYESSCACKNWSDALVYCDLLAYHYDWLGYKFDLSKMYYNCEQYENAVFHFNKLVNEMNNEPIMVEMMDMPLYFCGLSNLKLGREEIALKNFNALISAVNQKMHQFDEGADINLTYKQYLSLAYTEIGKIYFNRKEYEKCNEAFDIAYQNYPTYDTMYYRGYCFLYGLGSVKSVELAETLFDRLIELKDECEDTNLIANSNYQLGLIYCKEQGYINKIKALEHLNKAKEQGIEITDYEIEELISKIPENNSSTTNKNSGGCYVATCVYGSYDCPEVWTLRRFRDNILAENVFGRLFIKFYYAVSPTAVRLFGNYHWFHKIFKAPLDSLVEKLIDNGVENTPYNDQRKEDLLCGVRIIKTVSISAICATTP